MHCVMHYVMHHVMHYTFQVCREVFAQSMREHGGAACSHARLGTAQGPSSAPAPRAPPAPPQALRPLSPQAFRPSGPQGTPGGSGWLLDTPNRRERPGHYSQPLSASGARASVCQVADSAACAPHPRWVHRVGYDGDAQRATAHGAQRRGKSRGRQPCEESCDRAGRHVEALMLGTASAPAPASASASAPASHLDPLPDLPSRCSSPRYLPRSPH